MFQADRHSPRKRDSSSGQRFLPLLAVAVMLSGEGLGQEVFEVNVNTFMVSAGDEVSCPLYLKKERGAPPLQGLRMILQVPEAQVKFVKAEPGAQLKDSGVNMRAEAGATSDEKQISTLRVELQSEKGKEMPDGLLLYLTFRVDASVPLGAQIPLDSEARAVVFRDGKSANVEVGFPDVVIRVSPRKKEDEILFACFFYMH
ncbi:MAG: hypothetical protein HY652_13460 [Acidobacteria bacterium]|nr:hypothetical protein [Acidobacteriota bacterium]